MANSNLDHRIESILSRDEWTLRRRTHVERVQHLTKLRVAGAGRGEKHPIFDFLFDYYSFRAANVEKWSPGFGVLLEGASLQDLDWPRDFVFLPTGAFLSVKAFAAHRLRYLQWAISFLERTRERPATFSCFGLHEWAMLYRSPKARHSQIPFRISEAEIDAVVERSDIRCSHFDAYRFFTPDAVPLNRTELSRLTTIDNDQSGCLHVNMDLYRFAVKAAPYLPSELLADAFLLAADTRIIDMRATPYDFSQLGYAPIPIETREGREEYVVLQRAISERARPIRDVMIREYRRLAGAVEDALTTHEIAYTGDSSAIREGVTP